MSAKFAASVKCVPEELNESLYIATPLKIIAVANIIFKNCIIQIGERKLTIDLVPLDKDNFDISLGIN